MPQILTDGAVRRWLADLPIQQLVAHVDRQDRERVHEFGNSYQTTLWVSENPSAVEHSERRLRTKLRNLENEAVAKAGGIAVGWAFLALVISWVDRLSRGYMTGRLRLIGVAAGLVLPAGLFLV